MDTKWENIENMKRKLKSIHFILHLVELLMISFPFNNFDYLICAILIPLCSTHCQLLEVSHLQKAETGILPC